jgi:predicted chitinase
MAPAAVADCSAPAWNSGAVYVANNLVTHGGLAWRAKWWTQGETPGTTGQWGVWEQIGTCGGEPPVDPPSPEAFPVSEAQFNSFFPNRNSFYTYSGLVTALSAYPAFANTGSETIQRREAAAFLANVSHETGGLVHIVEQNTANYPHYCDTSQSYGCPAGHDQYYGRGPIQLSWNFNYRAAGIALGIDLLNNPRLVQTDSAIAWKTGLWYWNTQNGPGTMTPHNAIVNSAGFGETIRSINGSIECNGGNPGQVQSRVDTYLRFTSALGVDPGGNLYC